MTDSKPKKYIGICFKCKEFNLTVPTEDSKCPICGGELKIIGERLNIMTSNGQFKKHL